MSRDHTMSTARAGVRDALLGLRELLERAGYRELHALLTGGAPFAADARRAAGVAAALGGEEAALLALFALGEPVDPHALDEPLVATLESLVGAGLATKDASGISTTCYLITPLLGGFLATGRPPGYAVQPGGPDGIGASAYLGPDSLRLAAVLPRSGGRRVLDIGTGCGVQGLLACPGASLAVLTDVDERSLELAGWNAVLSGVEHPVELRLGDCYEPVDGEVFDLIVSLPPYVPEVPGSATRSTVGAGKDGLRVLRDLLAGALEHLAPGGELVARCQLLCADDGPLAAAELESWTEGLDCRVVLSDWHPLQPYVVELASSLAAHGSSTPFRDLVAAYSASLRALGATGIATAVIHARRPEGRSPTGLTILGVTDGRPSRRVPARVAGLEISADPGTRSARISDGPAVLLDGPTAALLAAVDGKRAITELVSIAWGAPAGAAQGDLEDQAIARLQQLERSGLVYSE